MQKVFSSTMQARSLPAGQGPSRRPGPFQSVPLKGIPKAYRKPIGAHRNAYRGYGLPARTRPGRGYFYRFFTVGSTDISAKNCTTFVFMFFFHEKIYNLLIFLRFLPVASFSFIFINFRSTFHKIIIWTYNSPMRPCPFNRKLNFDFFSLIPIVLSHGKRCFMSVQLFKYI